MEARGPIESMSCAPCDDRRGRRRRRPAATLSLSALALLAGRWPSSSDMASFASAAVPSSLAGAVPFIERRSNGLRHRRLQNYTNSCTGGSSLYPGDNLTRGEFLCHGELRFGIEAEGGQFILGFASASDGNGTDDTTLSTNSTAGAASNTATPTSLAWTAIPTTLFIEPTRPFAYLTLTEDGNILGYDAAGLEIFDSNYDRNRVESKEDNSMLTFSDDCLSVDNIGVEGEMCVTIKGPAQPGMPYGMVTWGVEVTVDDIISLLPEPEGMLSPTPAPAPAPAPTASTGLFVPTFLDAAQIPSQPTPRPTRRTRRPSAGGAASQPPQSASNNGIRSPSISPSKPPSGNLFESMPMEATSIIWGTVWRDSDRNGRMDLGEETVEGFEVKLLSCDAMWARSDQLVVERSTTDEEGMYFFQVPSGRTYRVQFEIDEEEYRYSEGEDTDSNMVGFTDCAMTTREGPIQWNVGLYDINEPVPGELSLGGDPEMSVEEAEPMSSIGGFIYLDVDEDGGMDSKERTAAVGGYTVNDAVIIVTLSNCQTSEVLGTQEVSFPGTYSFTNLTEGWYRLGYDMEVMSASSGDGEQPVPLYSFVDSEESEPTYYETQCGKLGTGEDIDSGNVGLRMRPLDILPYVGDAGAEFESDLKEQRNESDFAQAEGAEGEANDSGGGGSPVGAIVGVLVTLSIVAAVVAVFIKRHGGLDRLSFPFLSKGKVDGEDVRSVGSSIGREDKSLAGTPSGNQTAIGSLIVETGKSVAGGLTAAGESDDSDSSDSDSSDSEEESYTGMEFALKGAQATAASPYSPAAAGPLYEGTPEEEGYEVYDDEDEEGSRGADYGPVISNMIARYTQQAGDDGAPDNGDQGEERGQDQSQEYPEGQPHAAYDQNQPQYDDPNQPQYQDQGEHLAIVPSDNQGNSHYQYHAQGYQQGGYYPSTDETSTSGTSASSRSSDPPAASYRDIPASGGAPQVGWDTQAEFDPNQYAPQEFADGAAYAANYESNQYGGPVQYEPNQFHSDQQYHAGGHDGGDYEPQHYGNPATHDEDGNNYAPTDYHSQYDAVIAAATNYASSQYESDQYAANGSGDGYTAASHGGHAGDGGNPYPASGYDEQMMSSDDDESSEEASASGWSTSSSTTGTSAMSGMSSVSGGAGNDPATLGRHFRKASLKEKARRAQSNPRDDRRTGGWRYQAAIPENSTLEYNAYSMAGGESGNGSGYSGYAPAPGDDNRSVHSAGSGGAVSVYTTGSGGGSVYTAGSDQSSDPPGASYKNLNHRRFPPPPPPRKTTPPRIGHNGNYSPPRRVVSPNTRRGRSVPPPPPRGHPSPPPPPR